MTLQPFAQKIAQVQAWQSSWVAQNPLRVQVDPLCWRSGTGLEDVRTVLSQATVESTQGHIAGASQHNPLRQ